MRTLLLFACLTALSIPLPAVARANPPEAGLPGQTTPVSLPKTPAGTMLGRVLETLADPGKELGAEAFSPVFQSQVPYPRLLEAIKALSAEHGAMSLQAIQSQSSESALVARVRTGKTNQVWQVHLGLDADGRIETLLLRPAPADAPPPAAAADEAPAVPMPDSPAGRAMSRVLESLADPGKQIGEDAFADSFKAAVPYAKLVATIQALHDDQGAFRPVKIQKESGPNSLTVRTRTAKTGKLWDIILNLDAAGKIEGLLARPAPADGPPLADWAALDSELAKLPGSANFGAYRVKRVEPSDGAPFKVEIEALHEFNPEARLAIGSTFKLYVLGTLAEQVAAGKLKWDQPLAINPDHKSLPSGTMQNEPAGKEFPISHYAGQMISISDNTATDHLFRLVTRFEIEDYMARLHDKPAVNNPFLTTREIFALKLGPDPTLLPRYIAAGEAIRRDMLVPDDPVTPARRPGPNHKPGEIANTMLPDLKAAEGWTKPRAIDKVEWFATPRECARVMADLHRLELLPGQEEVGRILRLNPGGGLPFDPKVWTKIGFKGGSEPGVINLTFLLTRADGQVFVMTSGWNDPKEPLDESRFLELIPRAAPLIAR